MSTLIETGWVKPPKQIGGLDHLGVQAPCIQIYSQLLPGITNVTDRARYYSFYPWLLSRFEKAGWRAEEKILTMLRRAECLLTMVALHHEYQLEDGTDDHRAAMVGVDTLTRAIERLERGESVTISEYSSLDAGKDRYFANPVGGLGQYYFGVLRSLGLLDGESPKRMRLPDGTGTVMAEIFEHHVPGDLFIKTLSGDRVTKQVLDKLTPFCGCMLKSASRECEVLANVMIRGWEALNQDEVPTAEELEVNKARAHSLAYFCLLADAGAATKDLFTISTFRGMSYTGVDSSGNNISLPAELINTTNQWRVYQRNELLSVAIQGLFYCALRGAELSGKRFRTTSEMSAWFWFDGPGAVAIDALFKAKVTVKAGMIKLAKKLPDYTDWTDEEHEIKRMERLSYITSTNGITKADIKNLVIDSLMILAAILQREENRDGYSGMPFPEGYLEYYPVNLDSVREDWAGALSDERINQWLSEFVKNRCLDTHLRVAMRKLRQQGQNTFRFEPSELGLVIKQIPRSANTSPRFRQALRILMDLGLLDRKNDLIKTTARGKSFIKAAL